MKNKKGISLIVLVITIIVMIILAASIILTLNNSGIINRANEAVEKSDLAQVKNLAALKWSEAYLKNEEDLREYVISRLTEEGITTDKYDITITTVGVDVALKEEVPVEWTENVVAMKDGVPIPKGFVASPYSGERTKAGGLVIYELAEGETVIPSNETQQTSWTTRNQYVWVPVSSEDFVNKFVRQNFGMSTAISNTLGTALWEVELDTETNIPLTEQDSAYMTDATLKEVQAMYASVKEYGGFYIARYEAGIRDLRPSDNGVLETNVYSMMGKVPYTQIPWSKNYTLTEDTGGAVQVARNIYPSTNTDYGVVSTLTYGVQWDTMLQWLLDTGAVTSVTNSVNYGNYSEHVINSVKDLNEGALVLVWKTGNSYVAKDNEALLYPKASGMLWLLSTGALKAAKINNIYDLAGNINEWTMECYSAGLRVARSGSFDLAGTDRKLSVSRRGTLAENKAANTIGFRPCLYIK